MVSKSGADLPTIPVTDFHDDSEWLDTDLYENELYVYTGADVPTLYTRKGGDIIALGGADKISTTVAASGVNIDFTRSKVFNSPASPGTANITEDLTGALLGIVQKIYHEHGTAPTFPAGWVRMGSGTYDTTALNVIYAEWVVGSRVEYWITQES